MDPLDETQQQRLEVDVAERLRGTCEHMSPGEFRALVAELVAMKARFRAIEARPELWYPAPCHSGDMETEPPAPLRPDSSDNGDA